jgi:5-methyltetrahydropteroyltriglutamate--homocysteine methyltransferase
MRKPTRMKRSTSRILTTHVGSLARPARLLELARARQEDDEVDARAYDECLRSSVAEVVRRQVEAGIDVVE